MLTQEFLSEIGTISEKCSSFEEFKTCLTLNSTNHELPILSMVSSFRKDKKKNTIEVLSYLVYSTLRRLGTSYVACGEALDLDKKTIARCFSTLKNIGATEGNMFTERRTFKRKYRKIRGQSLSALPLVTLKDIQRCFKYIEGALLISSTDGEFTPAKTVRTKHGYDTVSFMYRPIGVHRLVYALVYGEYNGKMSVDHIDGNRSNNSPNNLRMVTTRENNQNRPCHRAGKLVGSRWHPELGIWTSQCSVQGVLNINGPFSTEEEAHASYLRCLRENNLPFIGDRGAS